MRVIIFEATLSFPLVYKPKDLISSEMMLELFLIVLIIFTEVDDFTEFYGS